MIYVIGWIAYGLMFFLAYLDVKWIFAHYKIFVAIWVIGHLFLFDIVQIYYELLKRKDKEKPSWQREILYCNAPFFYCKHIRYDYI